MSIYINVLIILLLIKYAINMLSGAELKKSQNVFLVISSIILALFTGLRDKYTGADTSNYGSTFLRFKNLDFSYAISEKTGRFESGYKAYMWLIRRITDNVNLYFTITAILVAICVGYFIYKNSKNPFMSMILYYTVGAFTFQMTGLRQSLAMAILLLSVEFIKEKKLIRFIILVWLASLFHQSALCFLIAYPIANLKINFKNFVLYFGVSVFMLVYNNWVSDFLSNLFGYEGKFEIGEAVNDVMGGATVIGMLVLTLALCGIFYKRLTEQDAHNKIFFNLTMLSLIIYVLRYVIRIFERVSFYYQFAFIILLPNAIEAIPDAKTRKTVYFCAIFLACALFFYRYQIKPSYYGFFWK